jgi:hypothetical protein
MSTSHLERPLGLEMSDENLEAELALMALMLEADDFIDRLPDQPTNPNRVPAIGSLALDDEYLSDRQD